MRPACEPGYEAQCAQEGPYADNEVTEVEDMTDYVAAMHRDGTEDDVQPVENQMQQDAAHEAMNDPEDELYLRVINMISQLHSPKRVAAVKNHCEIELRKWDEENSRERREIDAAMGKRTRTGRRTRSDAGTKRAPKDGVAA